MNVIEWLDGKKTVVGAFLQTLVDLTGALLTFFPALQDEIVHLGVPEGAVATAFVWAAKGFLYIGLLHKGFKTLTGAEGEK